jgi:hypothetical protein
LARFPIGTIATVTQIDSFFGGLGLYNPDSDSRETVTTKRHHAISSIRHAVRTAKWQTDPTLPDPYYILSHERSVSYRVVSTADAYSNKADHSPEKITHILKGIQTELDELFATFRLAALEPDERHLMQIRKMFAETLFSSGMRIVHDMGEKFRQQMKIAGPKH